MLVKVTYIIGASEDAELFNWDSLEQRAAFQLRCEDTVRRGGRFILDASPRHRAVLMSVHCKRCKASFTSSKCPVCGLVVGRSPMPDEDPWDEDGDRTPLEKGKGGLE
jgi:hypothetical protein